MLMGSLQGIHRLAFVRDRRVGGGCCGGATKDAAIRVLSERRTVFPPDHPV
jgi:hypothetical protein